MNKSTNGLFERTNALNYPLVSEQGVSKKVLNSAHVRVITSSSLFAKILLGRSFFYKIHLRLLKLDQVVKRISTAILNVKELSPKGSGSSRVLVHKKRPPIVEVFFYRGNYNFLSLYEFCVSLIAIFANHHYAIVSCWKSRKFNCLVIRVHVNRFY